MKYLVVGGDGPTRFQSGPDARVTGLKGYRWNLAATFPTLESATDAATSYIRDHPGVHLDILELESSTKLPDWPAVPPGRIAWCSKTGNTDMIYGTPIYTKGELVSPTEVKLPQPINVDREQAIAKLQENLDEEKQKREAIEAREKQDRLDFQQFVTDHEDEIVEFLGRMSGGSWREILESFEKKFEDDAYKPKGMKPGHKESDLEKMVRVLSMSVDKTIEVQPDAPIYALL